MHILSSLKYWIIKALAKRKRDRQAEIDREERAELARFLERAI